MDAVIGAVAGIIGAAIGALATLKAAKMAAGNQAAAQPALVAGPSEEPVPVLADTPDHLILKVPDHLKDYCEWALEQYRGLRLLGVGAGDVQLPLRSVYVPLGMRYEAHLRYGRGEGGLEELALGGRVGEIGDDGRFGLDEIFSREVPGGPHVAIFGDPGAGKTTALRKLLYQCLAEKGGAERLGLAADTIPVFLRLRRITSVKELGNDLEPLLRDALAAESEGGLAARAASELLGHGRLLLLLDGLDEMADDNLRRELCRFLNRRVEEAAQAGSAIRMVVSCRRSGYGGIELEDSFRQVVVQPLNDDEIQRLVRQWFGAVEQQAEPDKAPALRRAQAHLLQVLREESPTSERLKLASSPLLLTLLCIVVYKGHEIPRRRVQFFQQCLEVLLSKWSVVERGQAPLLDVETALAVLRPLAYQMHRDGRQYDLREVEFLRIVGRRLRDLGQAETAFAVLRWLRNEAGILTQFPGGHGFVHLAIQEYLAALHIASEGEALFGELCDGLIRQPSRDRERGEVGAWREVLLLLVGMPGGQIFSPLMKTLVASDLLVQQTDLLRECLEEAAEVQIQPILEVLEQERDPDRQVALLGLLRKRSDERVLALARQLVKSEHSHVKARAEQIVEESRRREQGRNRPYDLALLYDARQEEDAARVEDELRRHGFEILRYEIGTEGEKLQALVEETSVALLLCTVGGKAAWEEERTGDLLRLLGEEERPRIALFTSGDGAAPRPETELLSAWFDARDGIPLAQLEAAMGAVKLRMKAASPEVLGEAPDAESRFFEEPQTGIRWLWVPEGRFEMGANFQEAAQPVHEVSVSGFWLGETPVTNRQYGMYLEAMKESGRTVEEPRYWRDRQYSSADQPVVGVSWEEAREFCRWLSKKSGLEVALPTEAQWEYAARGSDGRTYPWGNEPEPNSELACFGAKQPAAVGSYPAGKGPFGHLDLAGNVWEWCLDGWNEAGYQKHAARDPVIPFEKMSERVIRGGSWCDPAEDLRAAIRLWSPAGLRVGFVGFRVAAAAASL